MGVGIGKKGATVRWSVAGRMVAAWAITFPAAAAMGAVMYWVAAGLGGFVGPPRRPRHPVRPVLLHVEALAGQRHRPPQRQLTTGTTAASPRSLVAAHEVIDPHHELDEPQPAAGPAAH
jgi:hypothetical protein